jgi:hypothetical protein
MGRAQRHVLLVGDRMFDAAEAQFSALPTSTAGLLHGGRSLRRILFLRS